MLRIYISENFSKFLTFLSVRKKKRRAQKLSLPVVSLRLFFFEKSFCFRHGPPTTFGCWWIRTAWRRIPPPDGGNDDVHPKGWICLSHSLTKGFVFAYIARSSQPSKSRLNRTRLRKQNEVLGETSQNPPSQKACFSDIDLDSPEYSFEDFGRWPDKPLLLRRPLWVRRKVAAKPRNLPRKFQWWRSLGESSLVGNDDGSKLSK